PASAILLRSITPVYVSVPSNVTFPDIVETSLLELKTLTVTSLSTLSGALLSPTAWPIPGICSLRSTASAFGSVVGVGVSVGAVEPPRDPFPDPPLPPEPESILQVKLGVSFMYVQ